MGFWGNQHWGTGEWSLHLLQLIMNNMSCLDLEVSLILHSFLHLLNESFFNSYLLDINNSGEWKRQNSLIPKWGFHSTGGGWAIKRHEERVVPPDWGLSRDLLWDAAHSPLTVNICESGSCSYLPRTDIELEPSGPRLLPGGHHQNCSIT